MVYRRSGVGVTYKIQQDQLPSVKEVRPEYKDIDAHVLQDVLRRLDKAYQAFFARHKQGHGFPKFHKSRDYGSITFPDPAKKRLVGNRVYLPKIGTIKIVLHRPVEGDIKTTTLTRDRCGDWFVVFSCDNVPEKPLPATGKSVGIDVGLEKFLATSDGDFVANPRFLQKAEAELRRVQRQVDKRQKGSNRRKKLVKTLARKHRKVARARKDFHFNTAAALVRKYDMLAVESLNVRGLSRGMLAKSVHDVGWGQFLGILGAKAAESARVIVKVNPAWTSQICSGCGHMPKIKKTLSERTHHCPACGLTMDRDTNAARNILAAAVNAEPERQAA